MNNGALPSQSRARTVPKPVSLSASCEEAFCRFVMERTGIVVHDHQLTALRTAITDACERFCYSSSGALLAAVEQANQGDPTLEFLLSRITVGESYFFRDADQMSFLQDAWLPELVARKRANGDLSLRVWSAGCAQGQEIYSIAMLLEQQLPDIERWNLHLLGTDINPEALAMAMRARYSRWSMRAIDAARSERFFSVHGGSYELRDSVRARARFAYLNLIEDTFPAILTETTALDLILCRNVFIYLHSPVARRIMEKFAACLVPDGVLMLGASDLVEQLPPGLRLCRRGEVWYYRRDESFGSAAEVAAPAGETVHSNGFTASTPKPPAAPAPLVARQHTDDTRAVSGLAQTGRAPCLQDSAEEVADLIDQERWQAALAVLERLRASGAETARLARYRCVALANLGRLQAAAVAAEQGLARDAMDAHAYLIYAMVLIELDRLDEGDKALRRALYLQPSFAEAHYHLGILELRRGRRSEGLKRLGNALRLLESDDPNRAVDNAPNMTAGRLAEVLRAELAMYAQTTSRP